MGSEMCIRDRYILGLLNGNVNYFEYLYLPRPINCKIIDKLAVLVDTNLKSKKLCTAYLGYGNTMAKQYKKDKKLKQAVLSFRMLLVARGILEYDTVFMSLPRLMEIYEFPLLRKYFDLLKNGQEFMEPEEEFFKTQKTLDEEVIEVLRNSDMREEINKKPVELLYYSLFKNEGREWN